MKMSGRAINPGEAEGEAIVSKEPVGFYGNIDMKTGVIIEKGHPLEGVCISGKVFVFPHGKGSTVGSYVIYGLKKNGVAPLAIINKETETIVATGVILADIPCLDGIDIEKITTGDTVKVKIGEKDGFVEIKSARKKGII
jgi:predicted aconitase with swiveling domain